MSERVYADLVDWKLYDRFRDVSIGRLEDSRALGRWSGGGTTKGSALYRQESGRDICEVDLRAVLGESRYPVPRSHVEPDREHSRHRPEDVLGSTFESESVVLDGVLEALEREQIVGPESNRKRMGESQQRRERR